MKAALGLCFGWCKGKDEFLVVQSTSFGNCSSSYFKEEAGDSGPPALCTLPASMAAVDPSSISTPFGDQRLRTEGADPLPQGLHQPPPSTAKPRKSILKKKK